MTCSEAREAMLDAEPAELRGDGTSAIAEHVRSCLTCRRAAAAIATDTCVLVRVAHHDVRVRRGRRRAAIAGLAAAGIVVAFAVRAIGTSDSRPAVTRAIAPAARHVATARPANPPDTATPSTVADGVERATRRRQHSLGNRIQAVAIQPAAFVAVPLRTVEPAAAEDEAPTVSVSPHGGRRAAVFRVAESKVTVVWLY